MMRIRGKSKPAENLSSALGSSTADTHSFRVPINSRCQGLADNDGGATRPSDLCYAVKPSSVKPRQPDFSPDTPGFSHSPHDSLDNPLNVGTLNVSTLRGKMSQVLSLAEQHECHIFVSPGNSFRRRQYVVCSPCRSQSGMAVRWKTMFPSMLTEHLCMVLLY